MVAWLFRGGEAVGESRGPNGILREGVVPGGAQVLFCRLSGDQRELYKSYLASKDVESILAGDRNALAGIDVLRKICNHPDLLQARPSPHRYAWSSSEPIAVMF